MTRAALRLLACLVGAWCWVCTAHATGIVLISGERSAGYAEAAEALLTEMEKNGMARTEVRQVLASELSGEDMAALGKSMFVTLGTDALRQVLARAPRLPVLATLIPRSSYERVLKESDKRPATPVVALYLDQPFTRQLDLLRLALPEARRVGVLWGPESQSQWPMLSSAAQSRGLELVQASVTGNNLFNGLKTALEDADVFLAVADPQVFNSSNISNILLATYRARIPMVAFSPAYVRAGALLSLHTTPTQIGNQAAQMVRSILQGGGVSQYPMDFHVSVNEQVARSLGLQVNAEALTDRLRKMERKP